MKLLFYIVFVYFIISCSQKETINDYKFYKVAKKEFINKITLSGTLEAIKTNSVNCPNRLNADVRIIKLTDEGLYISKHDTICVLDCPEMLNSQKEAIKNLEVAQSEYEKVKANQALQIMLLETEVKLIESGEMVHKMDSLKQQFLSPTYKKIAEMELQIVQLQKEKIQNQLFFLKKVNTVDLQKYKIKIQQQQNKLKDYDERLSQLYLKSPSDGIIQYLTLWSTDMPAKVGDIVWENMPLLKVVDMSEFQIKFIINENNYKLIQKDQRMEVSVDAYKNMMLNATIKSKKPAGSQSRRRSPLKWFEAYASLDSTNFKLTPGLSVTCNVMLNQIKDTCVVPINAVFDFDSSKVVYVLKDQKAHRRVVETGINSNNEIVISKGLKYNETIFLSQPSENLIQ